MSTSRADESLTAATVLEMADTILRDYGPPLRIVTGIPGVPPHLAYKTVEAIAGFRWLILGTAVWQALLDGQPTLFDLQAPRGTKGLSLFGTECEPWDPRRPQHLALWREVFGKAVTL